MGSTVKINGTTFELVQYFYTEEQVSLTLKNTTISEIERAVNNGEGTIIVGDDEYVAHGMTALKRISKDITDAGEFYNVVIKTPSLEALVARHTEDITVINEAIEELAILIGGDK